MRFMGFNWLEELREVYKPAADAAEENSIGLGEEERYHVISETLVVAQENGKTGVAFANKAKERLKYFGELKDYLNFSKQFSRVAYAENSGNIKEGTAKKLIENGLEKLKELGGDLDKWREFIEYDVLKMPKRNRKRGLP